MVHSKMKQAMSVPVGVALGAACSLVITMVICGIFAKLIDGEVISPNSMDYGGTAALLCGSISGAWLTLRKTRQKPLLICTLAGVVYFLILLALHAILSAGEIRGVGVTAILVASGSIVPALLNSGKGTAGKGIHKKHRYR